MSVLDQSRTIFSSPSKVLRILVEGNHRISVPDKESWSWREVGDFLEESIGGKPFTIEAVSAWDRVQSSESFQLLLSKYTVLADLRSTLPAVDATSSGLMNTSFVHQLLSRCSAILSEMSLDCMQSSSRSLFMTSVVDRLQRYNSNFQFTTTLINSPSFPISQLVLKLTHLGPSEESLSLIVDSGITLTDVACIAQPHRRLLRECIYLSSLKAKCDWSRAKLLLCERFDLIEQTNPLFAVVGLKNISTTGPALTALSKLQSDKPSDLSGKIPQVPAGVDTEQLRQRTLLMNAHQVVARPLGRAACLIGVPSDFDDGDSQAFINLSGKFGDVGIVSLDASLLPIEALYWPEFQNGFALGISSNANTRDDILQHKNKTDQLLTSKKRVFGIPPELVPLALYRHAGYLLAGLLQSSPTSDPIVRSDDLYRYLKQQNEWVSISAIFGFAVSRRKTCSEEAARLCLIHIPGQVKTPETEFIDIPLSVQSAAIAGLGFVYAESCNRQAMEAVLAEMARKPIGDKPVLDRESLSFSSGLAIGLISLGKGTSLAADIALADRLIDLIETRQDSSIGNNGTPFTSSFQADLDNSARVSLLLETATINRAITLPGACIALGLAFMNSCDSTVSDQIRIPSSVEELETSQSRPDALLFKLLAKSLIQLPLIQASWSYIEEQLPLFLRDPVGSLEHKELRQPGSETPSCVDWLAIAQARLYAITGICIAIALKHAGSNDEMAKCTLSRVFEKLVLETDWPSAHCAAQSASRPSMSVSTADRACIETCRAALLLSMCLVAAGSGDALVRSSVHTLAQRMDEATPHGIAQAVSMARGFLFLGMGKRTFRNDPLSIACLLAAVIPRYSSSVSDQKSNLQVLRNVFVVAAEERGVNVIDVGTMDRVNHVPVLPFDKEGNLLGSVHNERYMPSFVDKERLGESARVVIQRRIGQWPHNVDPMGTLSSDRAYISSHGKPSKGQIQRLLGLPLDDGQESDQLDWFNCASVRPTSRRDWRLTPAELAAVTVPRDDLNAQLKELQQARALLCNMEPVEGMTMSEKYCHILPRDTEYDALRLLDECVKKGRVDLFLDSVEDRVLARGL